MLALLFQRVRVLPTLGDSDARLDLEQYTVLDLLRSYAAALTPCRRPSRPALTVYTSRDRLFG